MADSDSDEDMKRLFCRAKAQNEALEMELQAAGQDWCGTPLLRQKQRWTKTRTFPNGSQEILSFGWFM